MRNIDAESNIPAFEQLHSHVIEDVRNGMLAPGAKLPTVRQLAEDLHLAPNTVAKAYRALERDGIIVTRGRHGTFVAPTGDPTVQQAQTAATAYAERIAQLKLSPDEAIAIVTAALRAPR